MVVRPIGEDRRRSIGSFAISLIGIAVVLALLYGVFWGGLLEGDSPTPRSPVSSPVPPLATEQLVEQVTEEAAAAPTAEADLAQLYDCPWRWPSRDEPMREDELNDTAGVIVRYLSVSSSDPSSGNFLLYWEPQNGKANFACQKGDSEKKIELIAGFHSLADLGLPGFVVRVAFMEGEDLPTVYRCVSK